MKIFKHSEEGLAIISGVFLGLGIVALVSLILLFLAGCGTTPEQRERVIDKIEERLERTPTPLPAPEPEPTEEPESEEENLFSREIRLHGGGFLWKPISENGKLVVLTPASTKGGSERTEIRRILGDVLLETGRFSGIHNGGRPHWRFTKKGEAYGDHLVFRAIRSDQSFRDWKIPEGAARIE